MQRAPQNAISQRARKNIGSNFMDLPITSFDLVVRHPADFIRNFRKQFLRVAKKLFANNPKFIKLLMRPGINQSLQSAEIIHNLMAKIHWHRDDTYATWPKAPRGRIHT
ncbi:protein of unknown function [Rhodovastum atsumiense]|nr:protein of unknown function [Rhodovastum atsumiense]